MKIEFFFGPDKIPFSLRNDAVLEPDSMVPFHGIISRGLLRKFEACGMDPGQWHSCAHLLSDEHPEVSPPELETIKKLAGECNVLTFGQSAYCAQMSLHQRFSSDVLAHSSIELWNIKEGHTTSVWKASVHSEQELFTFVVNVPRDYDAAIELTESSTKLSAIEREFPEINMARVLNVFELNDPLLPFPVPIVCNEWISDSFEIHSRINKQTGREELMLVDRFITDNKNPAAITSIFGRLFTNDEVSRIQQDILHFQQKTKTVLTTAPLININDGDVVWNGERAVIIAIS